MTAVMVYTIYHFLAYAYSIPKVVKAHPEPVFTKATGGNLFLGGVIIVLPMLIWITASLGWAPAVIFMWLEVAASFGVAFYQIEEYGGTVGTIKRTVFNVLVSVAVLGWLFATAAAM